MVKLIVEYDIGDGCTYHCTETKAIEYPSAEQLLVDIEDMANQYLEARKKLYSPEVQGQRNAEWQAMAKSNTFTVENIQAHREKYELKHPYLQYNGYELSIEPFINNDNDKREYRYCPPEIYTVDEWFAAHQGI